MATIQECAAHLGISTKYFTDLLADGTIKKQARGEYDLEEIRTVYIKRLRESAAGRATNGALNLADERARLSKEQADAKEMENAIERGELVYIEDVAKRFEEGLTKVRAKLLSIPTKIAPEAAAAENAKEVQRLIENAIIEALNELVGLDAGSAS